MSKRVKSQLEIYMEGLEMDDEGSVAPGPASSDLASPEIALSATSWRHKRAMPWVSFIICTFMIGVVDDALVVTKWFGLTCSVPSSVAVKLENLLVSGGRRTVQFFLTIVALKALVATTVSVHTGVLGWAIYHLVVSTFFTLVVCPVLIGTLTSWVTVRINRQARAAQYTTECLLGAIKRVQLVRMGSSISHPMPPVAKLEEGFLRTHSEEPDLVSFNEMRVSLRDALYYLHGSLCTSSELNVSDKSVVGAAVSGVVTVSQLEHLCGVAFQAQRQVSHSQFDTLRADLQSARIDCWSLVVFNMSSASDTADSGEPIQESRYVDLITVLMRVMWCVGEVLALPLRLCGVLFELEVYMKRCRDMSGGLIDVCLPPHTDTNTIDNTHTTPSSTHSYSDTYLSARQKLLRLRAAYEDISVRLYLADQQLSQAPTQQCILPDTALTTHNTDLCVANIDAALQRLCGNAHISHNSTQNDHNEVLEGIEMLLGGLPSLRDFELLCDDLHLLQAASVANTTPALYKQGLADSAVPATTQRVTEVSTSSTNSTLTMRINNGHGAQSVYEENSCKDENTTLLATNKLDANAISNILDVYTTTVPRRAVVQKKTEASAADLAAAARERSQAKLLFRELNQHLRRVHAPLQAPAEGTDNTATDARPTVPLVGQYTLERVRHITSKQTTTGSASEPLTAPEAEDAELQIETNLTQVDTSALELCQVGDSEDEDTSHSSTHKEEKKYRVGTVLLTEQEMRAASQASTSTSTLPVNDVRSFQEEMRQALRGMTSTAPGGETPQSSAIVGGSSGGGLALSVSAFALAMRSNHLQEATFGDDLSD